MRVIAFLILSILLLASTAARADSADGSFNVGPWRGSPTSSDGAFADCRMEAFFGRKDAPVALTIGLDRARGWMVAIRSDQLMLHGAQIKAGLAFDDEAPAEVRGDVISPTTVSFTFSNTRLLDRHLGSRKLVLIFSDMALPFVLSSFEDSTKALRRCLAAIAVPVSEQAAIDSATAVDATAREPTSANSRLFSEIVAPMMVGFVGSVLLVLLAAAILFQIMRARARSRYFRLWSAEYRSTATRPLTMGLMETRAAA